MSGALKERSCGSALRMLLNCMATSTVKPARLPVPFLPEPLDEESTQTESSSLLIGPIEKQRRKAR
jgi:hypothetical protein